MTRVQGVSYLRPEEGSIVGQFDVVGADKDHLIPGFSYASELHAEWSGHLSLGRIYASAGLPDKTVLRLDLTCESSPTGLTRALDRTTVPFGSKNLNIVLRGYVPGAFVGDGAQFYATLSIDSEPVGPVKSIAIARRKGQVLWQTKESVVVRGTGAAMAVQSVDFASQGFAVRADAPWLLQCPVSDLERSAASAIVLYVNSKNSDIKGALENLVAGGRTSPTAEEAYADVEAQLIRLAVDHDDLIATTDYPLGSIGRVLLDVVRRTGSELEQLRHLREDKPDVFEATLVATCRGRLIAKGATR